MDQAPPYRTQWNTRARGTRFQTRATGLAQGNLFEQPGQQEEPELTWEQVEQKDLEAHLPDLSLEELEVWIEHPDERFPRAVIEYGFQGRGKHERLRLKRQLYGRLLAIERQEEVFWTPLHDQLAHQGRWLSRHQVQDPDWAEKHFRTSREAVERLRDWIQQADSRDLGELLEFDFIEVPRVIASFRPSPGPEWVERLCRRDLYLATRWAQNEQLDQPGRAVLVRFIREALLETGDWEQASSSYGTHRAYGREGPTRHQQVQQVALHTAEQLNAYDQLSATEAEEIFDAVLELGDPETAIKFADKLGASLPTEQLFRIGRHWEWAHNYLQPLLEHPSVDTAFRARCLEQASGSNLLEFRKSIARRPEWAIQEGIWSHLLESRAKEVLWQLLGVEPVEKFHEALEKILHYHPEMAISRLTRHLSREGRPEWMERLGTEELEIVLEAISKVSFYEVKGLFEQFPGGHKHPGLRKALYEKAEQEGTARARYTALKLLMKDARGEAFRRLFGELVRQSGWRAAQLLDRRSFIEHGDFLEGLNDLRPQDIQPLLVHERDEIRQKAMRALGQLKDRKEEATRSSRAPSSSGPKR